MKFETLVNRSAVSDARPVSTKVTFQSSVGPEWTLMSETPCLQEIVISELW